MSPESALRYDRLARETGGLADSHRWLLDRVPRGATVLDCGCAGGFLARALVEERACSVDGVEVDEEAAACAARVCRRVFVGSLDDPGFVTSLKGVYDRVLFGDILEHLHGPGEVLRAIAPRVGAEGCILVSLPNVAYWRIRWELLRGRFDYQESGLLDRTHLRFYTYRSGRELVEAAGYRVLRHEITRRVLAVPLVGGLLLRGASALPNLFGYQTLIEAAPCRG